MHYSFRSNNSEYEIIVRMLDVLPEIELYYENNKIKECKADLLNEQNEIQLKSNQFFSLQSTPKIKMNGKVSSAETMR